MLPRGIQAPSPGTLSKSHNKVALIAPIADQVLKAAAEQLLVAFGPGAGVIDEQVRPVHGGGLSWVAGA